MEHHTLTNGLFNDLLDPRIPTLDVCRKHGIPITDLRDILASEHFRQAAEALIAAEELRSRALAPDRRERALATLDAIASQEPTTPTHTECIRRAAGAILRATKPDPREPARTAKATTTAPDDNPAAPDTPTPDPMNSGTGFRPVSQIREDGPEARPTKAIEEHATHPPG